MGATKKSVNEKINLKDGKVKNGLRNNKVEISAQELSGWSIRDIHVDDKNLGKSFITILSLLLRT